jgi:outer membrane protein assembly factor BamB
MKQFSLFVLVLSACFGASLGALAQELPGQIIGSELAARYGLKRSWLGQVRVDRTLDKVVGVALEGDALAVLTSRGVLELLDAETGTSRWLVQLGNPLYPSTGPGLGVDYVAITNGSKVYVVQRATGKQVFEKSLQQVAAAAPAVWQQHVYVPLFNGMLTSFDLNRPHSAPWYYRAAGHLDIPPLANARTLAWGTSRGHVFAGAPHKLAVRFQFQARAEIRAPLSYSAPNLFIASRDGFVYAVNEKNGHLLWRFAAGDAISQQPAVIAGNVFVVPESGGLYCLSAKTGLQRWFAPAAVQFVAASPQRNKAATAKKDPAQQLARVYAVDETGNTMILDARSGARLETIPTSLLDWKFTNSQNDRIYLGTTSGLIQCFHEFGLDRPTVYAQPVAPEPEATPDGAPAETRPAAQSAKPDGEAAQPGEPNPFEDEASP